MLIPFTILKLVQWNIYNLTFDKINTLPFDSIDFQKGTILIILHSLKFEKYQRLNLIFDDVDHLILPKRLCVVDQKPNMLQYWFEDIQVINQHYQYRYSILCQYCISQTFLKRYQYWWNISFKLELFGMKWHYYTMTKFIFKIQVVSIYCSPGKCWF